MSFSVVVLAAGKGTRMKSALPKVLHPIANKPMVQHIIDTVNQLGANQIHIIFGHQGEQLQSALSHNQLNWCLQSEQLGTGHAVQQAASFIKDNEDILILVGDVPLIQPQSLQELINIKAHCDLALLTVELEDPTGMGRIIREGDQVKAIVEHKDANEDQKAIKEINTGMMLVNGQLLKKWLSQLTNNNAQQEYYLTDIIEMAAIEGFRIQAFQAPYSTEVEGINNRAQLAKLERAFQLRQANELLHKGITLLDPQRFDLRGELAFGQDVTIDVNVVIKGKVTLGHNVVIEANCILENCVIGDNVTIHAFSTVQEANVESDCDIGPYARLRPGSVMKSGSRVGNFVEMKKTVLGKGSKANHLTYLGDAQIGDGVNIGAGTITCNYDGVNKFRTQIDDGAFIGSNSALVAPAKIGKDATVGAGSVITSEVPDGELAVSRAKQRVIAGWQRPAKQTK